MMKTSIVILASLAILAVSTVAQQPLKTELEPQTVNPQWFHGYPYSFPPMPSFTDDQIKCYKAIHSPGMLSCLQDLHSFFMTHKLVLSSTCCSALQNAEATCKSVVKYENPFLINFISKQCSATTTPPAS